MGKSFPRDAAEGSELCRAQPPTGPALGVLQLVMVAWQGREDGLGEPLGQSLSPKEGSQIGDTLGLLEASVPSVAVQ